MISCRTSPGRVFAQNQNMIISIRQIMPSRFGFDPEVRLASTRKPRFSVPCHQFTSADGTAA